MKRTFILIALALALLLCGCDTADGGQTNEVKNVKPVELTEPQAFKIDAVNYDISNIDGVTKLGESGVIYAYCTTAEGANKTIASLNSLSLTKLNKYDTENENIVLTVVTLGEGEKSGYSVDKVEIGEKAALHVYVKTNAGDPAAAKTGEYHFVRLGVPVHGDITVYLDGVQVGK